MDTPSSPPPSVGGLPLLLAAFALVAVLYGVLVPIGEHPDENFHLSYVAWLASRRQLPNAFAADRPVREAHQPPLYYALGAAVWTLLRVPPAVTSQAADATLLTRNPDFGDPSGRQNNRYLHTSDEALPFRGWVLSAQLLRLALLPVAMGVVASTYALARLARPASRAVPPVAAASVAFLPQLVFLSGSISNDLLPALFTGGVLLLLGDLIRTGWLAAWRALLVGVLLAGGLLSKDSMLTVLPAVALALVLGARRRTDFLRLAALVATPLVLLYGPYAARSWLLYGSPIGSAAQVVTVPYMVHAARSPFSPYFLESAPTLWGSFVAFFGWLSVPLGKPRLPYDLFALAALAGVALYAVGLTRGRFGRFETRLAVVLLVTVGGSLAGYVYHNLEIDSPQGRHLYTALPAIGVLVAIGLQQVACRLHLPPRTRRIAVAGFLLAAPAYAVVVGLYLLLPVYGRVLVP